MRLYEYQAKRLFAEAGLRTPEGAVAGSPQEARKAAERLGGVVAIKAQVPIGGRGKAGGIAVVERPDEAEREAARILDLSIRGYPVHKLLVEKGADIADEYYLGLTIDRAAGALVLIVSAAGGMDIEEVAETDPDKVVKVWLKASLGLRDFQARGAALRAGIPPEALRGVVSMLKKMHALMRSTDATLVEINPCARLSDGSVLALDGKMEIDENALYRQTDVAAWKEAEGGDHPLEEKAHELGLAYVKLDGEVGIIGNGAGLVMTTLDMIQRHGGQAANFLDIGGGAKAEVVRNALSIVLSDPDVKSVLLNVFGGITRCDEVAKGLLEVASDMGLQVPLVVRLVGTREKEGRALLAGSGLETAETFQEAARKAVELAKGGSRS